MFQHRYKLTPEYYFRRAVKAKTLDEMVTANIGLFNLFVRHAEYNYQKFIEAVYGSKTKIHSS